MNDLHAHVCMRLADWPLISPSRILTLAHACIPICPTANRDEEGAGATPREHVDLTKAR